VVQAFRLQEKLDIKISLLSYPDKQTEYASQRVVLSSDNNYQGLIQLLIQPKQLPRKSNTEQFVYLHALSNVFTKEEKVPVTYKNGFLFIQTDKPVYTPDQSVKIRVYSMDEELKPARRTVTLTFEDPEKVKVDLMVEKDVTGIISFPDFKIPANPKFGIWSIRAAYENDFTTSTEVRFEVKEYVLPAFFITIQPEKNFIGHDKFEDFAITVRGKYVPMSPMFEGETVFNFNSKKAVEELQYYSLEDLDGCYLYITVSVEEFSGGRTEESEYTDVKYVLSPYTLKLISTPLFVKPTLPYYIEVQLKDTADKPVGNIPIILTTEMFDEGGKPVDSKQITEHKKTNWKDGTTVFVVNIPADVNSLEFKLRTEDINLPEENQAVENYVAKSYKSIMKSYLYINWARQSEPMRVGQYLSVQVVPSTPYMAKIEHYSYLIISKGKILKSGTEPRVFQSSSQNLNFQITDDMIPSIRVLVYYIITGDTTAELIADSIWVDVEAKCVSNQKVLLSAQKKELKPKQDLSLTLEAQVNSLVALSALDVAVYDVASAGNSKRPLEKSDLGCGAGAGQDNADVFRLAGLTFLTNANIRASQNYGIYFTITLQGHDAVEHVVLICDDFSFSDIRTILDIDEPEVRSYFPESMCVAEPLQVVVWKDLFIDVQIPYSVVRGEQIQLKAVVYNHKNSDVKACVTVTVGKEICLFSDSTSIGSSRAYKGCSLQTIQAASYSSFTYSVLPLELGLHTINFTLSVGFESEILVKTLRVVPEGIQEENHAGFTLDPSAIRGKVLGEVMNTVLTGKSVNYLINLPKGSAETEIMRVLPIFYVYRYLATTKEWQILESSAFLGQLEMERKMKEAFTSLLSFRKVDFSYSVWRNSESSTWLTAFAIRIFGDIQNYVSTSSVSICSSMLWLIDNCQTKDGSFTELSSYQPTKLQVKIPTEARERSLYLTAFVLVGLSKAHPLCEIDVMKASIFKAEEYLSKNIASAQSTYSLAIAAYALSLSDVTLMGVRTGVTKLKGEAYYKGTIDTPIYRFWKDSLKKFDPTEPSAETARMVETTAYALLAFLKVGDKEYSQPVVKWLQDHQHYGGGFFSTQDTAIALEALTEVAILDDKLTLNMGVQVSYRKSGPFQDFQLTEKKPFTRVVEVRGGSHAARLLQISSDEYICATVSAREMFSVKMLSPATFRVYEFHAPGTSPSSSDKTRCVSRMLRSSVTSSSAAAAARGCAHVSLFSGLFPGIQITTILDFIRVKHFSFFCRYEYPLDTSTWIEWWPERCDSSECKSFSGILDEFSLGILLDGC
uniref:Complement C5 n=1 Tax=Leptobrachium leishanense TaxID=445787 RepID=A0A8C5RBB6_9ANUR